MCYFTWSHRPAVPNLFGIRNLHCGKQCVFHRLWRGRWFLDDSGTSHSMYSISNWMLLLIWQEKPIHILKVGDPCCRLFLLRKCFSYRIGNWDSERSSNQLKTKSKGNTGCEIWLQVLCTPSIFPPAYDTESLKGKLHVSLDGSKISQECVFQHQLVNSPETRPFNHHLALQSAHKHPLSRHGQ